MHIQKVLNSSVVLVQDDSGEESILLGKGIGYGRKAGEPIERQPSDRVFLPLSNPDAQPMLELFSSIAHLTEFMPFHLKNLLSKNLLTIFCGDYTNKYPKKVTSNYLTVLITKMS